MGFISIIVNGDYKITYNWGGHHLAGVPCKPCFSGNVAQEAGDVAVDAAGDVVKDVVTRDVAGKDVEGNFAKNGIHLLIQARPRQHQMKAALHQKPRGSKRQKKLSLPRRLSRN